MTLAIQQPLNFPHENTLSGGALLQLAELEGLHGRIAIDFESTGLDAYRDQPLGFGVWAEDANTIGFLPMRSRFDLLDLAEVIGTWRDGSWVMAHNLQFELALLMLPDRDLERFSWFDTQVAEHLLWEEGNKDLGSCEKRRLGTNSKKMLMAEGDLYGGIKKAVQWPLPLLADYCVNDCRITYRLAQVQVPDLRRQRLDALAAKQNRYIISLHRMERHGVAVSRSAAQQMTDSIYAITRTGETALKAELKSRGLGMVNYNSPKQLHHLLYKQLELPWPEMPPELASSPKAKKYNDSRTAQEFLDMFDHPTVNLIAQLKQVGRIHSYLQSYLQHGIIQDSNLILHPHFNPTGTVTGRLSSSGPNLQQVSSKPVGKLLDPTSHGIFLRSVFVPRPGRTLVSIDYKQMEVVLFALLCGEPEMVKMVLTGGDMHEQVAILLFGKYTPETRKFTKNLNFGLLYGLGSAGLAAMLGVDQEQANRLMGEYMSRFARVRPWMAEIQRQLKKNRYVRYWSGRKRRIVNQDHLYRGVNSVVQGGCADILAEATIRVDDYLRSTGSGTIIGLIHDEVLMEIDTEHLKRDVPAVAQLMRVEDLLGTPFNVDVEVGPNWGDGLKPFSLQ